MKHLWSSKSKSRVYSNHFSECIQDSLTLNFGYYGKWKVKLLVLDVAGLNRSLTCNSGTNNSVHTILKEY